MRSHRFTSTSFFIWGGLLIYALSFLVVYVSVALSCARPFGVGLVRVATVAWSVAAAVAILVHLLAARRRNRNDPSADEHTRFIRSVAAAASGLALLALAWLTLPALVLRTQCG